MQWTEEQRNKIRESVWRTGGATCPIHGKQLEVARYAVPGTDRQGVDAGCDVCRRKATFQPADDLAGAGAAAWTEEQKMELLAKARRGDPITCPSDGSYIEPTVEPALGSSIVGAVADEIHCGRCGQWVRGNR